MKIHLELVHKKAKAKKKVLLKADTIIGRSTECGLRVASNEVSRQHCKICVGEDGSVTVRDLGSSNGTFINGYQLEADTDYEIAPDSELALGGIKFLVRFSEPTPKGRLNIAMGSTVDLKPGRHPSVEEMESEPDLGPQKESPAEEEMHFAEAEESPEPESEESLPTSATGTVQMTRPPELDSVVEEPDFEISAHGDSAILEREEEQSSDVEAEQEVEVAEAEEEEVVDLELEDEPEPAAAEEEEVVDLELEVEPPLAEEVQEELVDLELEEEVEVPEVEVEAPVASEEAGEEEMQEDDVAAFLNQVGEATETETESNDEESLGDFFKQFGGS